MLAREAGRQGCWRCGSVSTRLANNARLFWAEGRPDLESAGRACSAGGVGWGQKHTDRRPCEELAGRACSRGRQAGMLAMWFS